MAVDTTTIFASGNPFLGWNASGGTNWIPTESVDGGTQVQIYCGWFSGPSYGYGNTLAHFDLSGLPAGYSIISIELRVSGNRQWQGSTYTHIGVDDIGPGPHDASDVQLVDGSLATIAVPNAINVMFFSDPVSISPAIVGNAIGLRLGVIAPGPPMAAGETAGLLSAAVFLDVTYEYDDGGGLEVVYVVPNVMAGVLASARAKTLRRRGEEDRVTGERPRGHIAERRRDASR